MANMGRATATAIMNAMFRNTAYTSPTTVYLALYTSDPTSADTGTEVSGGAYARQAITFGAPASATVDNTTVQQIANSADVEFPAATAAWATTENPIAYWAVRSAATGGTLIAFGSFNNSKVVAAGDQFVVSASGITINLA